MGDKSSFRATSIYGLNVSSWVCWCIPMYLQLITMLDRSDQEPLDEKGNSFLYCGVPRETNNDYLKARNFWKISYFC